MASAQGVGASAVSEWRAKGPAQCARPGFARTTSAEWPRRPRQRTAGPPPVERPSSAPGWHSAVPGSVCGWRGAAACGTVVAATRWQMTRCPGRGAAPVVVAWLPVGSPPLSPLGAPPAPPFGFPSLPPLGSPPPPAWAGLAKESTSARAATERAPARVCRAAVSGRTAGDPPAPIQLPAGVASARLSSVVSGGAWLGRRVPGEGAALPIPPCAAREAAPASRRAPAAARPWTPAQAWAAIPVVAFPPSAPPGAARGAGPVLAAVRAGEGPRQGAVLPVPVPRPPRAERRLARRAERPGFSAGSLGVPSPEEVRALRAPRAVVGLPLCAAPPRACSRAGDGARAAAPPAPRPALAAPPAAGRVQAPVLLPPALVGLTLAAGAALLRSRRVVPLAPACPLQVDRPPRRSCREERSPRPARRGGTLG
jgi:hypothetical protein